MPPRSSKSKAEKKCECFCSIYVALFAVILHLLNLFIYLHYGMGPFFSTSDHDNPHACKSKGYQLCTTARGKCTYRKAKCVYPRKSEECTYVRHIEAIKKDVRKSIEKAFKNKAKQLEQTKIRKEYCASEIIQLYDKMRLDLFPIHLLCSFILSTFLFALFYF